MYVCIYAPINASSFSNPECLHRALIEVPVRSLHPDTLSTRSLGQPIMIALIPIHVCMSMYEYVWVCMSMYEYVWVCIGMYEYVWVCMSMYEYVWVCIGMYEHVWVYMSMYKYV